MNSAPSSRVQTSENLRASYDAIETLIAGLDDAGWDHQSLCPDWTSRGVVAHLAAVESILIGWKPEGPESPPLFTEIAAFESEVKDLNNGDFADRVKAVFLARRQDLDSFTAEDFARQQMTPVGPGTYQRFMDVRVFDFWVHERDIATPLGIETNDSGPTAERSVDEVEMSLGYIIGKKVGLPEGKSIGIHLTGPIQRDMFVAVDGRAKAVDHIDTPSTTLTTDSSTFVQLACGRLDPQTPIDAGKISWSGDLEWGEKAARNLAFTM